MTKYLPFYLDTKGFMTNQKCFIITGEHLNYLVGFLNSKIFYSLFRDNFPELLGGTRELSKIFFEKIRIKKGDDDTEGIFKPLVEDIQKKTSCGGDTKKELEMIDDILYSLLGFTAKEKSFFTQTIFL